MALIACPECNGNVSSAASSCPHCGYAIAAAAEFKATGTPITTVQETSKRLKIHTLIATALIIVGTVWIIGGVQDPDTADGMTLAPLLVFVGLVWFVVTRFRIWWHHK